MWCVNDFNITAENRYIGIFQYGVLTTIHRLDNENKYKNPQQKITQLNKLYPLPTALIIIPEV